MRIENIRLEKSGERSRVVAAILWEDCDRPVQEVYFETAEEFADGLSSGPNAHLVASIMPALHFGEERLAVDGEVCPELKEGLITAMNWMRFWWYKPDRKLVTIEAKASSGPSLPRTPERAALFFSGGIDALATMRANRLNYPLEHPGSMKDGLLVCGLEIRDERIFGYVMDSVSALAEDAGITLIPVYTNIRSLGPENDTEFWDDFWLNEFMGACFAAIAYAFKKRLTKVSINSSFDIPSLVPHGSHPLIDPSYSNDEFQICHEGINLSRFEKTKIVAGWDLALRHLRVCNKTELYQSGMLNCGRCEKCVRTMIALLALGVLEKSYAFPTRAVTEDLVMTAIHLRPNTFPLYEELKAPLHEKGLHHLVRAIERKIHDYHRSERRTRRRKAFIEPVLEYDQKKLGGSLRKLKRTIFPSKGVWTE